MVSQPERWRLGTPPKGYSCPKGSRTSCASCTFGYHQLIKLAWTYGHLDHDNIRILEFLDCEQNPLIVITIFLVKTFAQSLKQVENLCNPSMV